MFGSFVWQCIQNYIFEKSEDKAHKVVNFQQNHSHTKWLLKKSSLLACLLIWSKKTTRENCFIFFLSKLSFWEDINRHVGSSAWDSLHLGVRNWWQRQGRPGLWGPLSSSPGCAAHRTRIHRLRARLTPEMHSSNYLPRLEKLWDRFKHD